MVQQFLQARKPNNIDPNIFIDLKRISLALELDKVNLGNRFEKFNQLAATYYMVLKHCEFLTKYGAGSKTPYHQEMELLEQFITYLIEVYSFPQSFEKLIQRYKLQKESHDSRQASDFQITDTKFENVDSPQISAAKSCPQIDIEDF